MKDYLKEQYCLEVYGWFVHYVMNDCKSPYHANIHTHGLLENFKHFDLQICMQISPEIVHPILTGVVNKIKTGSIFEENIYYTNILLNYKVKFINAVECDRTVLRMILPDKAGCLESADMDEFYKNQYTLLNNN